MIAAAHSPGRLLTPPTRDLAGLRGYVTNLAACRTHPVTASRQRGSKRNGPVNQEVRQNRRRCRTIEIQAGRQTITAADPLPDELRQALDALFRNK